MSRAIKFKIWNKRKNQWHHKEPINLFGEVIIMGEILNANLEDNPISLEELNDLVPLQFTGLLDKQGKEIYEGDIVENKDWFNCYGKYIGSRYVIKFGEYDDSEVEWGSAGIGFYAEKSNGEQESPINICEGVYVIGNIYSNPDLLSNEVEEKE